MSKLTYAMRKTILLAFALLCAVGVKAKHGNAPENYVPTAQNLAAREAFQDQKVWRVSTLGTLLDDW